MITVLQAGCLFYADDGIDILWCRCDETISYNDFGDWLVTVNIPLVIGCTYLSNLNRSNRLKNKDSTMTISDDLRQLSAAINYLNQSAKIF